MGNETEESEIEGVEYENEGVDNGVLPPERKGYSLRKPPNVKYSDKRANRISMGWNNLIVGSNEIHSVENPISMLLMLLLLYSNQHHQPTSSPTRTS